MIGPAIQAIAFPVILLDDRVNLKEIKFLNKKM
jgi:hypothetical protein